MTRIGWGCVICNPDKNRLAKQPEVPVVEGPAERVGCLQHGEINCERCGLLETRHRLAFDQHRQDEKSGSWVRDERGGGIGVALVFVALMLLVVFCGGTVWTYWPR